MDKNISEEGLGQILERFDLGEILETEPLTTSGNITYLINTHKGQFLLRLCPFGPRFRSKEEILSELELIEHLLKHHFPVSVPIAQKDGQKIISFQGRYGYLREFNKGEPILKPTITEIERFGEALGWFHSLTADFKTTNGRKHIFDLEQTLKHFRLNKKLILKSNFKKAEEFVQKVEDELSQLNFPQELPAGMIHEDLGKRHVLWEKGEICSIIDFDRSYFGKLVLDLGQALRGWCFIDDFSAWSNENAQVLLFGYQKKRKLTDLEKKYLLDAVKFGVLERGIAFSMRFIEVTEDPEDEDFAFKSAFDFLDTLESNRNKFNQFLIK